MSCGLGRRAVGLVTILLGVAVLNLALRTDSAVAHSFLVATAPAQGQRLDAGPDRIVLEFSERVDPSTVAVAVLTSEGDRVETIAPEVSDDGLDARVAVDEWLDGIFVVEWSAFSALDGHGSSGEFAFAIGDVAGVLPSAISATDTDVVDIVTTWAFFVGLAVAAGTLLLTIGTPGAVRPGRRRTVAVGVIVAMAAVGLSLARASSGSGWLLGCLNALAVALVLIGFRRGAVWAAVALVVAAGSWAARGHGSSTNGWLGWSIDVLHLVSAAAWAGALAFVVVMAWIRRRRDEPVLPMVRHYATRVVALVVVTGVTGVAAGWGLVPSWSDLASGGYGRLVSTKAALLLVAVALAVTARVGLLSSDRVHSLRRVLTVESIVVVAALGVAAILVNGPPPQPVSAAEELLGPPPLEGAVTREAGLAGQLTVYVGADGDRLDVLVVTPSGPERDTSVSIVTAGPDGIEVDLAPRPCGPGCFTQGVPLIDGTTALRVSASASDWIGGTYVAELDRPPGRLAPEVLVDVIAQMRSIDTVTVTETVSSGPGASSPAGTVSLDGAAFIQQEPYAAGNVDDVRFYPGAPDRLVLYLPGSQIFAELDIDDQRRLVAARLVTPSHEITRTFAYQSR